VILPIFPGRKLILIPTRVFGPTGEQLILRFILDTGATSSMLSWSKATKLGYSPMSSSERAEVSTASGVEYAPVIHVLRLEALGQQFKDFPILCHSLPFTVDADGILGLDFLAGHRLTIDFRIGLVTLE